MDKSAWLRLRSVTFAAGPSPASPPVEIEPGHVTLLVGPNNSGKSVALQQIVGHAQSAGQPQSVVASVDVPVPATDDELRVFLGDRILEEVNGHISFGRSSSSHVAEQTGSVATSVVHPGHQGPWSDHVRQSLAPHSIAQLDARGRLQLAQPQQVSSPGAAGGSTLNLLLADDSSLRLLSSTVQAAIGLHLLIDSSQLPNLRFALSRAEPPEGLSRDPWDERTRSFLRSAKPLDQFSDGTQMYVGLVAAVETFDQTILAIDEPEAFLHPTLARKLGRDLARLMRQRDANLVAATHSPEFLLGCLEETDHVTVVRLGYDQETGTARALRADDIRRLSSEPLLRSAQSLSALFARAAVVCEGDSDRAFYEEINRRLSRAEGRQSSTDAHFLNAQNWQTISHVAGPLRRAGVPAAMVFDFDALVQTEHWDDIASAAGLHLEERANFSALRTAAAGAAKNAGRVNGGDGPLRVKALGLQAVNNSDDRAAIDAFIDTARTLGIFLVPTGGLESWLPQFGCTNKKTWVVDIFKRLGTDGGAAYVQPGFGDCWQFVEEIATWTAAPDRGGMHDS